MRLMTNLSNLFFGKSGDGMVTELYVERQQNELGNGEEGQRNGNKG